MDCDQLYIGQIKRSIGNGYKEDLVHFRLGIESSAVVEHLIKKGYHTKKDIKLVKAGL